MTLPLLYQLQNATFTTLSETDFRVAVIDPDDSALTANDVSALQTTQDKLLYAYTSIGEAEDYRDYWDAEWTDSPPDFLLAENADWEGNFRVKFWDADWQNVIYGRIDDALAAGYDGVYLDIVDGYTVDEVIAAYPGSDDELRQEMIDFVVGISEYAKAVDPDFAIIPQNAVGLLGLTEDGPESGANAAYISAIDGLGVEDLWFNDDQISDWTDGDLSYIALAQEAGKFVLATSYPATDDKQAAFIENAIAQGLIPFAAQRDLGGVIDAINAGIDDAMDGGNFNAPWTEDLVATDGLTVDQFAVQYSNLDAAAIAASPYDLMIVEGKPGDAANAELSDAQVADLVAAGTTMVGYVSVGQTDDARPYWDASWTTDGTDTGAATDAAPSWLGEQADSYAAAIVEFWNPEWQSLVIGQVEELAARGFNGIFLDNMLSYYEVAALRDELGTEQSQFYAQEMMKFVGAIAEAGQAINPDFIVIPNGGPYIVGDAGYAADSPEAEAYYGAIDTIMAESFFGLFTGNYDAASLQIIEETFADKGIDVLVLEYATDPDAIAAFQQEAEARGFAASVSADMALDTLPDPLPDVPDDPATVDPVVFVGSNASEEIYGAAGDDQLSGRAGVDILAGDAGDDIMSGGSGYDELFGEAGNDTLFGDMGQDYIEGGSGADVLVGGRGHDELVGGQGADQFVFAARSGWDVISDFDVSEDTIVVEGTTEFVSYQTDDALVSDFEGYIQIALNGLTLDDQSQIVFAFV